MHGSGRCAAPKARAFRQRRTNMGQFNGRPARACTACRPPFGTNRCTLYGWTYKLVTIGTLPALRGFNTHKPRIFRMMNRTIALSGIALACALTVSTSALAQTAAAEPAPAPNLTANVTLTSNYKFRGQDQDVKYESDGSMKTKSIKPAIQGGFDYAFGSTGFYVGNWNSSVGWLDGNSIESDVYGGYKFSAGGLDFDVGTLGYIYPGATQGNTWEIYGAMTYASDVVGAFTLKYSHTVSDDYFGWAGSKGGSGLKGTNTGYINLAYTKAIIPALTFKAAVGYTSFASDISDLGVPDYTDYSVGLAYDFGGGLSLYGGVAGANKSGYFGDVNKSKAIVSLTKTL